MPQQQQQIKQARYPSIDAGRLRHRITILQPSTTSGIGGAEVTYTPLCTCYAAIEPTTATDVIRAGQTVAEVEIPITIRYRAGILPDMKVQRANGSTYVVKGIINVDERDVLLTLMCVALGNQP